MKETIIKILTGERDSARQESEARHQSCLVLMKSVDDHRRRIRELEAKLDDPDYAECCSEREKAESELAVVRDRNSALESALRQIRSLDKNAKVHAIIDRVLVPNGDQSG